MDNYVLNFDFDLAGVDYAALPLMQHNIYVVIFFSIKSTWVNFNFEYFTV